MDSSSNNKNSDCDDTNNTNGSDNKNDDDDDDKLDLLKKARSIFHGDSSYLCENPRKCCSVLSELLLYLPKNYTSITKEVFTDSEITEVFFGVTKLFVSNDAPLRRLLYLFLKDAVDNYDCVADVAVYVVFSSLRKDFDLLENRSPHRRNALRIMARIIRTDDATTFPDIEKRMRWSINPTFPTTLISSTLVSASNLLSKKENNDFGLVIKQWVPEITKVLISQTIKGRKNSPMIPFHAIQLLYQIQEKNSNMGVSEFVQQYTTGSKFEKNNDNDSPFFLFWKDSPLVLILLIRCYTKLLCNEEPQQEEVNNSHDKEEVSQEGKENSNQDDEEAAQVGKENNNNNRGEGENNNSHNYDSSSLRTSYDKFVMEFCLYHKSDMVVYEAARSIILCYLSSSNEKELLLYCRPAITILQLFLSSSNLVVRFAAARTLGELYKENPHSFLKCTEEFNNLLQYLDKALLDKMGYTDLVPSIEWRFYNLH